MTKSQESAEETAERILKHVDQFVLWDLTTSGWNISKSRIVDAIESVRKEGIREGLERGAEIADKHFGDLEDARPGAEEKFCRGYNQACVQIEESIRSEIGKV